MKLKLEEHIILAFLKDLESFANKSQHDDAFLKEYTAESLYAFDSKQWISIYKTRRIALQSLNYSWTQKNDIVNKSWFFFGLKIGRLFSICIMDFILPGQSINEKDRIFLETYPRLLDLYADVNGNLRSFCRFVISFESSTRPYDEGYILSLYEAEQIRTHYDWEYFCQFILPLWRDDKLNDTLKYCTYLLLPSVSSYFAHLNQDTIADRESCNESILTILSQELGHIDCSVVYAFYSKIQISSDCHLDMIEVLLACTGNQTLHDRLPYMIALARWIGMQNPSMIINHPCLDDVYESLGIGPFCSKQRVRTEIDKLLIPNYSHELDSRFRPMISDLSELLDDVTATDHDIFNAMRALNQRFDANNQKPKAIRLPGYRHLIMTTNDYVYNQHGINAQIIFINQLLSGWGFLERHDVACYYRFMMDLKTDIDPISGQLYSYYPLSHCVRPNEGAYLAVLDNSIACFAANEGIFENVNACPQRPFTEREYTSIQLFSAKKFKSPLYKRIAEYPVPPIKRSYLNMFIDVVNMSLDFNGLIDGYELQQVVEFPKESEHHPDMIYIKTTRDVIQYSVMDRWLIDRKRHIFQDSIPTYNPKLGCDFHDLVRNNDRLRYIYAYTGPSQHTRPNYSEEQLMRSAFAYTKLKQQIDQMPASDKLSLYTTKIRLGNGIRTFGELWADGFPECMTYASKGFAVLVLTYFRGEIKFDKEFVDRQYVTTENQSVSIGKNFIADQREIARARKSHPIIIEDVKLTLSNASMFTPSKSLLKLVTLPDPSGTSCKSLSSSSSSRSSSFGSDTTASLSDTSFEGNNFSSTA
jgi:hypothetical protein